MNKLKTLLTVACVYCVFGIVFIPASADNNFEEFANEFYTEMFVAGETSKEVDSMYAELLNEYDVNSESELYEALEGMYNALESNESATGYQLEVMNLINE